jgi:hypothetical protein
VGGATRARASSYPAPAALLAVTLALPLASCGEEPKRSEGGRPEAPIVLRLRQNCLLKPEGFDCAAAAHEACRKNGYEAGESVEQASGRVCRLTSEGRSCKAKTWLVRVACW